MACRAPARPRKQDGHKWGFLPPSMGPSPRGSSCLRGSERRKGDQLGLKPGKSLGVISISDSLLGAQPPRRELPLEGSKCPKADCWGSRPGSPGKAQPQTSSHRLGVSQRPQPSGGGQPHRFTRLSETGKTQCLGEFSAESSISGRFRTIYALLLVTTFLQTQVTWHCRRTRVVSSRRFRESLWPTWRSPSLHALN